MKERIQRPFKIILFPVLCFYTSAQVYAGIVDDNKALLTEYCDLYLKIFGAVGIVFLILSVILFRLYRQKQKAYRDLVRINLLWAKQHKFEVLNPQKATAETATPDNAEHDNLPAEPKDFEIVEQAHQFLNGGLFKDIKLDVNTLAEQIDTHPKILSHAINRVTGKHFNQFINEYRIKEALRIMSHEKDIRFKALYEQVGFNSYTVFYRTFKQITGLYPREFKNSKEANA